MTNIYYLDLKYGRDKRATGYILDISRGGMSIACSHKVGKDTKIEIITHKKILLPMKGRVVAASPRHRKTYKFRLGVGFTSLTGKQKQGLEKFMSRIERRHAVRLVLINLWKQD
ncbi:PilZ domain-containing protein [Candidatus Omnitrophota bacterium]